MHCSQVLGASRQIRSASYIHSLSTYNSTLADSLSRSIQCHGRAGQEGGQLPDPLRKLHPRQQGQARHPSSDYATWLNAMNSSIQSARVAAAHAAKRELILLYRDMGHEIVEKQETMG